MISNTVTLFRLAFGLILMAFVGMGIFGWEPPPIAPEAEILWGAIYESGYLIPAVLVVYFLAGLAFITNRFVPLASIVLFPVSLNIFLFHVVMNPHPRSVSIALALILANSFMLYQSRRSYAALLEAEEYSR